MFIIRTYYNDGTPPQEAAAQDQATLVAMGNTPIPANVAYIEIVVSNSTDPANPDGA